MPRRPRPPLADHCSSEILVLAVDPAATSGWAIATGIVSGELEVMVSGVIDTFTEPGGLERVIGGAVDLSRLHRRPLAMAIEHQSSPFGGRDIRAFAGLCEARGCWRRSWSLIIRQEAEMINPRIGRRPLLAVSRLERVPVGTWRKAIFGGAPRMDRAVWKARAVDLVRERHGLEVSDDEAEAILLAEYALRGPLH